MKTRLRTVALVVALIAINTIYAQAQDQEGLTKFEQFQDRRIGNGFTNPNNINVYKYKHVFKISIGNSNAFNYTRGLLTGYQDTSICRFQNLNYAPCLSFAHEIYIDNVMSIAYCIGFLKSNVIFNNEAFLTKQVYLFVKPKLNILRRKKFEAYMQLNVGLVYNDMKLDRVPSDIIERRLLPNFKMYTGFTPIGLNFKLTEHLWANLEASLFSYENLSFGLKYKFKANMSHPSYGLYANNK